MLLRGLAPLVHFASNLALLIFGAAALWGLISKKVQERQLMPATTEAMPSRRTSAGASPAQPTWADTQPIPGAAPEPKIAIPELPPVGTYRRSPEAGIHHPINMALPARPSAWSIELLREIEWKRFELLSAAYFQEIGFTSKTIRCGSDGGIDATLFRPGSDHPEAIVQCKAWNTYSVGVKPVRELLGVMASEKVAKGIFMTTGKYTSEALAFARSNPLELIDGPQFLSRVQALPGDSQDRLLAVATDGDYKVPSCPSCGIKMVYREGTEERKSFWGCPNYPRGCRQKFFRKLTAV
jgi:restriction system protein